MKDWRSERAARRARLALQTQARMKGFAGYIELNEQYQGRLVEPLARHVMKRGNLWCSSWNDLTTLQGDES